MKCRICETEIPDQSNFCPVCGSRQTLTHCINCGNPVSHDAAYCPQCGILIYKPNRTQPVRKKRKGSRILVWLALILILAVFCFLLLKLAAPLL